ncbi:MAG: hypothetical protein A2825_00825 [Candidatus Taylorbacteria bacterium RIFCSPHIGHO2_01_FULL_43_120]|nr:MAG: hypothetical protein A2825_00825 [Candidatus Taylorbacteria bacterium RIFCSPHIGHO2_01_FULL_43_120]
MRPVIPCGLPAAGWLIMKIILASDLSFLLAEGYALTGIPKEEMRIGYVITASKGDSNTDYVRKLEKDIAESGYKFEEYDIEDKTARQLREFFSDKNVIQVEGGNTYYLLKAFRKTGFDKMLNALLKDKIYIGTSAGSSILGPTIELTSHAPENVQKSELKGLGLVPFLIKCHYKEEKEEEYKAKLKDLKYSVKFLRDSQGFLIENEKITFHGTGQEVKI